MSAERGGGMRYAVRGDLTATGALLAEFFAGRGWRVEQDVPSRLEVETGSIGRTLLLGAFAGRRFHLRARLELTETPGGTRIRYRWGASVGHALGGAVGSARAGRRHVETAEALAERLRADGILLEVAPER